MAGLHRDSKWLKEQLSRVLGWDELIVQGLVDAVMRAASPGGDRLELDEMVQNFMADNPEGIALINDFLTPPPEQPPSSSSSFLNTAASGTRGGASAAVASKSYAASASASSGAPKPEHHHHQQQHQQKQQQQQRQQGRGARQPQLQQQQSPTATGATTNPALSPAAAATAPGWQALSSSAADAATPPLAAAGCAARVVDNGDDFSRVVVGDRGGSAAAAAEKPCPGGDGGGSSGGRGCGGGSSGGKVLGMFKAGGRIRTSAAKPVAVRGADGGALALAASLERKVINCLGCGKIYDCRSVTNDILRFLDRGGVCTFCSDKVPLSYKDRQKAAAAAPAEAEASAAAAKAMAGSATASGAEDAATAAARAFKDRLVEYDRNAAKRTTVIDDQSDFFEIDTNAWLTDQEREELRRRRQLEAEAEAARRKRLTVTIDIIGRKVVLDEDVRKAAEAEAAAAAERSASAAAKAASAAAVLRNTDGDGSGGAYGSAFSGNTLGGAGSGGPTREQLAAALDSLRRMKAVVNPAVTAAAAALLFLPMAAAAGGGGGGLASSAAAAAGGSGTGGGVSRRCGPGAPESAAASSAAAAAGCTGSTAGATSKVAAVAAGGGCAGAARSRGAARIGTAAGGRSDLSAVRAANRSRSHERVQYDLGVEFGFDAFGAEVALDELMDGRVAPLAAAGAEEAEDAPYDICLPDNLTTVTASSTLVSTVAKAAAATPPPRTVPGLPPGVVLLKGYLTMDEQIQIVRQIRELGIGPGGFYVPSYGTGAQLALQMMCLGLHWEPRTSKYEPTRSSYDGATPPPIPAWLVELCGRCLGAAASAAASSPGGGWRLPHLQPDICLANFYERSGRLGMHQDKDEMPSSLRAGLPVVSLSLGDAADFLYGRTRDPEQAAIVRLESGDVLVFGGPSRLMFHAVARIYPDTAPRELVAATGLRPGRLNLTFRQYRTA